MKLLSWLNLFDLVLVHSTTSNSVKAKSYRQRFRLCECVLHVRFIPYSVGEWTFCARSSYCGSIIFFIPSSFELSTFVNLMKDFCITCCVMAWCHPMKCFYILNNHCLGAMFNFICIFWLLPVTAFKPLPGTEPLTLHYSSHSIITYLL